MTIHLAERAVVEIAGPEARAWLHSLLTADIAALPSGACVWAGLLTPQGKILHEMFVWAPAEEAETETLLLDVPAPALERLLARLRMYKLRRRVTLAERPDLAVLADVEKIEEDTASLIARSPDPRWAAMGERALARAETAAGADGDAGAWHARRIELGLPDGALDIGSGKLFPHEANFDQLGAVSFSKGCYVGQEVVSRMQHRGTARNRLLPVRLSRPVAPETPVTAGEKRIGEITGSVVSDGEGARAIALLRLDRLARAVKARAPVRAGAAEMTPVRPPWAGFEVPGAFKQA